MGRGYRGFSRGIIIVSFLIFSGATLVSEDVLKVGFQALSTDGATLDYLSQTVPALVYRELAGISLALRDKDYFELLDSRTELKTRFDKALSSAKSRKTADEQRLLDRSMVRQAETTAQNAKDGGEPQPLDERRFKVTFWQDHEKGFLIPSDKKTQEEVARKNAVDLLIHGKVESYAGILKVSIYCFDGIAQKNAYSAVFFASLDDLEGLVSDISDSLSVYLCGYEHSTLVLTGMPDKAIVTMDGQDVDGTNRIRFLRPGSHALNVRARGFKPFGEIITLAPKELKSISLSLLPEPEGTVRIESGSGPGKVYLDSEFRGETPLTVTINDTSGMIGSVVYEEGKTAYFKGNQAIDGVITVLKPNTARISFEAAQDKFYDSLGAFLLSTTATTLCFGVFEQYYNNAERVQTAYLSGKIGESQFIKAKSEFETGFIGWQIAAWTGAAVTAATGTLAVIDFTGYLDATRR